MTTLTVQMLPASEASHLQIKWDNLAASATVANPFFESWMLLPALTILPHGEEVFVVTVVDTTAPGEPLVGLFPVVKKVGYKGIKVPYLEVWRHPHCYFAAPLVREGREEAFWAALFSWLDVESSKPFLIRFSEFPCEHRIESALISQAAQQRKVLFQVQTYQRASLSGHYDPHSYRKEVLGKRAKQFRQKEKKLAKEGALTISYITAQDDFSVWVDRFLRLEKESWKGRKGTAMASTTHDEKFFRQILDHAAKTGQLQMAVLLAGSQIAAIRTGFVSGGYEYSYKIAYNEALGRFSPGVLLELSHAEQFLKRKTMTLLDSCAAPDVRMLNQVLKDKRTIAVYEVSTSRLSGKLFLKAIAALTAVVRVIRRRKVTKIEDEVTDEAGAE